MNIVFNGQPRTVEDGLTIAALLELDGLPVRQVAVEEIEQTKSDHHSLGPKPTGFDRRES